MAVPQFSGNPFIQSLNGMNNFFGGLQANRQAMIQNQYLPQQLQLANQGQDIQNQTNQFNLSNLLPLSLKQKQLEYDTDSQMSPIQVALAKLGLDTKTQLSPIEVAQAQANLQGTQNTNTLFPLTKQNQSLQNQYLQAQINSANNPLGTGNMRPGQPIIDPQSGQVIGYTPTTQALGQAQQMNAARQEAEFLQEQIKNGLSPYQGLVGNAMYAHDLAMYKAGMASDEQKQRLIKYQAAVGLVPIFVSAQGRAATGGVPSQTEMEAIKKSYNYPETGIGIGGLGPEDFQASQDLIKNYQREAGNQSVIAASSPITTTGKTVPSSSQKVLKFNPSTGKFD